MALELPELTDFLGSNDFNFRFKRKKYEVSPSAEDVLRFQAEYRNTPSDEMTTEKWFTWGSMLGGGSWNQDEYKPEGGVWDELLAAGAGANMIDRIIGTIVCFYYWGPEAGERYYTTGDLGKALNLTTTVETKKGQTEAEDETA